MSILNKGIGEKLRWYYPFGGAIIATAIVITNAWSVFYPYIMDHFAIDASYMASIAAGSSAVGWGNFIIAPITGAILVDRFGPKVMYALSAILELIGLSCIKMMCSGGPGDWAAMQPWWLAAGLFIGWGIGYMTATANPMAAKWCPEKTGLAIGIVNIGPALGPVWATQVAARVIPGAGLETTFTIMILVGVCFTLVFGVLAQRAPEPGYMPEGYVPPAASVAEEEGLTLKQALRTKEYWCMFLCTFLCCFGGFGFAMNAATIVIEGCVTVGGMEEATVRVAVVATAMSIANIINAIARPAWGAIATKLGDPWKVLMVLYIGFIVVLLLFSRLYTTAMGAIVAVCLVYCFFGGTSPLHQSAGPVLFGPAHSGQIMNTLLLATGIAWILGPYVGGFIKGATGSYVGALYLSAAMVFIALCIVLYVSSQNKKKQAAKAAAAKAE